MQADAVNARPQDTLAQFSCQQLYAQTALRINTDLSYE